MVRRDCRAFDRHTVFFCRHGRVDSNLIIGVIPMFQAQIIILCLQIDIRKKKFVLDHLPENPGHLIAVHFNKRCLHLNFSHRQSLLPYISVFMQFDPQTLACLIRQSFKLPA